jgi:anti-sigma B factor antagonist
MRQPEAARRATAVTSTPAACQACRDAAMREDIDPVHWVGQQAVVALLVHRDASNAGQIREGLLSVINGGAPALIADMTVTTSCDHASADAVVRAFQRAVICGTELRLVVTAEHVSRVLGLSGLDHLVPIYPSLEAARAASPPTEALAVMAGPGFGGSRSWGGSAIRHGR